MNWLTKEDLAKKLELEGYSAFLEITNICPLF